MFCVFAHRCLVVGCVAAGIRPRDELANDSKLATGFGPIFVAAALGPPDEGRASHILPVGSYVAHISAPDAPVWLSSLGDDISAAWAHDVVVLDGRAYCSFVVSGFAIYDMTIPRLPVRLAHKTYPNNFTHNVWPSEDRRYLYSTVEEVWEAVASGGPPNTDQRRQLRLAASQATMMCASAVDILYNAAGGSSLQGHCSLQKHFRDIHAATQHRMVGSEVMRMAAAARITDDPVSFQL